MNETPETERLVFVVHKHRATTLHYDFRLEIGGVMRTSAIPKGPTLDPQMKRQASPITDHSANVAPRAKMYRKRANTVPAP